MPQANITINLLSTSRTNPKLSACTQIFGQSNCNDAPLMTPSCKCRVHEKLLIRGTCPVHNLETHRIETALRNYRFYEDHMLKISVNRISDKITFLPHDLKTSETMCKQETLDFMKDINQNYG